MLNASCEVATEVYGHDNHCLNTANALIGVDPKNWVADKAYVGNGMITPIKTNSSQLAGLGKRNSINR